MHKGHDWNVVAAHEALVLSAGTLQLVLVGTQVERRDSIHVHCTLLTCSLAATTGKARKDRQ